MKKRILAVALFLAMSTAMHAQVKTPAASPKTTIVQTVGLTDVEVEYSRPSAKGRAIFGDLVPFGKTWRTGANFNSLIKFGDDVVIDGKTLPKGQYALFVSPGADSWDVYFYKDTNNWGLPEKWEDSKVALKAKAKATVQSRFVETFTIGFNNLQTDSGDLEIMWDRTLVSLKIDVPTKELATKSIERVMAGPSDRDYYSAAQYYYASNDDAKKALEYVNKAVEISEKNAGAPFFYTRLKSLIQARLGDYKGAISTAKISLTASEKAGNADYIKMNNDSIAEWSKK